MPEVFFPRFAKLIVPYPGMELKLGWCLFGTSWEQMEGIAQTKSGEDLFFFVLLQNSLTNWANIFCARNKCVLFGDFFIWLLIKLVNYSSSPTSSSRNRNFDEVSTHSRKLNPKTIWSSDLLLQDAVVLKLQKVRVQKIPQKLKFRWKCHKWPRHIHTKWAPAGYK